HTAAGGSIRGALEALEPGDRVVGTRPVLRKRLAEDAGHEGVRRDRTLADLLQVLALGRAEPGVDQGTQSFVAERGFVAAGKRQQSVEVLLRPFRDANQRLGP